MSSNAFYLNAKKRTIYIDNPSYHVTKSVLETALNQFGTVTNIQFVPTYFMSCPVIAALVEMQTIRQADDIVNEMNDSPLMVSGMPRPVRAQKARVDMFHDYQKEQVRLIICQFMDPNDPKYEVAKSFKKLTKRQAAEAAFSTEHELAVEEKLHNQQNVAFKANYKKYELIDRSNILFSLLESSHRLHPGGCPAIRAFERRWQQTAQGSAQFGITQGELTIHAFISPIGITRGD
ncbi:ASI1-immunoprecipitated protein 1-like [Rutidosis leptorrhynchoides]|uniref:ASI1-immunoprecipitated protein 1-like n=1 Tax=Rutidosis leptorrhynchoides TaxID=125765 RepID=UPI003A994CD9